MKDTMEEFLRFSPGPPEDVRVFFAPGRINLIGEHTDYNGGYVLPGAIEYGTWCCLRPRADRVWRFASSTSPQVITVTPRGMAYQPDYGFANYPLGVVWALTEQGIDISGADLYFSGNLPQGAGLSSSASLELAAAMALTAAVGVDLGLAGLASIAHRAENQFVGVPCGIMDQYAVALGQKDHVLSLSAATLDYQAVAVPLGTVRLVITNTNKPHHLVHSPYRDRLEECRTALALLRQSGVAISHLAALEPGLWDEVSGLIKDPVLKRRCRHVVLENDRARKSPDLLRRGDFQQFGILMRASHESLRDDYDVTGIELDTLAEAAWEVDGCLGSRMTGAGFGGATVSLVDEAAVPDFEAHVGQTYRRRLGRDPSFLVTRLEAGVHEV